MEQQMVRIRKNLKTTQDRHKSCVYLKISYKEFKFRDHVYVRLNRKKSSLKLGSCAKLAKRYCGPFEVLDMIGIVAYKIALPANECSQFFS